MSSGHGANKPDKGNHPGRRADRAGFGIGDVLNVPGHGVVTVGAMGKRYFTGTKESGERLGPTGIGLATGEGMHGEPAPWKIEKK